MMSGPTAAPTPRVSPIVTTRRALVLNATFEPLGIVSSKRAVLLVLDTKAELVHVTDRVFRSERVSVPEPSVVRLVRYVQIPRHYRVAVNRRTVFARDGSRCQYCGSAAENLDHVIPRSRGGQHTWENVVAACRRCNTRKEDHLPHEVGMVLRSEPGGSPTPSPAVGSVRGGQRRLELLSRCRPGRGHRLCRPRAPHRLSQAVAPGGWRVERRTGTASELHAGWPSVDERPTRRVVAVCRPRQPALVLGSTQSVFPRRWRASQSCGRRGDTSPVWWGRGAGRPRRSAVGRCLGAGR